ncbi:MAG TPA: hypothetical protein VHK27_01945 [Gammaproteobacteria bacterium]|nr:hypothetical protein [Gammaproteobacteria bacterium]
MKRYPVRGQAVIWCECGEWFTNERDKERHKCPGSPLKKMRASEEAVFLDVLKKSPRKIK